MRVMFLVYIGLVFSFNTAVELNNTILRTVAWSPNGQTLAIGGQIQGQSIIWLYDITSNVPEIIPSSKVTVNISWSPLGRQIAIREDAMPWTDISIWARDTMTPLFTTETLTGTSDNFYVIWSPTGRYIAANGSVWVYIIDTSNGEIIAQLWDESLTGNAAVLSMAWSEDERSIIALYNSPERNQLLEWNVTTAQVNRILWSVSRLHPIIMSQSADGQQLAVSVGEGSVFIFNTATGEIEQNIVVPRAVGSSPYVSHLFWSADNQTVYGVTTDGTVYLWDTQTSNLIAAEKSITGEFLFLRDVDMSPYRGQLIMVIASHSREITPPSSTDQLDETILLDGLAKIIVPAPSLDRLNAIAALCVRDGNTGLSGVQGLAQPAASITDLPAYIARVEALPADAIPPACRADLLAVAGALLAGE